MSQHQMIEPNYLNLPLQYVVWHGDLKHAQAPHWHEAIELNYVMQGALVDVAMNEQLLSVETGQTLIVNTGVAHSIPQQSADTQIFTLYIMPDLLAENGFDMKQQLFFRRPYNRHPKAAVQLSQHLAGLHDILVVQPDNRWRILAQLYTILDLLVNRFSWSTNYMTAFPELLPPDEPIHDMIRYIRRHLTDDALTPTLLAGKFHVSASYLARYFQKIVGMSPNTFIQRQRLQLAQIHLKNTQESVGWIAEKSGFSSEKSLQRAFNKHLQISPKQYRDQFKNRPVTK
jgi:AraC-like DNA-binding protein